MNCRQRLAGQGVRPRASHVRMMRIVYAQQVQMIDLRRLKGKPKKVGLNHSFEGSEFDDSALQPDHGGMSSIVGVQF